MKTFQVFLTHSRLKKYRIKKFFDEFLENDSIYCEFRLKILKLFDFSQILIRFFFCPLKILELFDFFFAIDRRFKTFESFCHRPQILELFDFFATDRKVWKHLGLFATDRKFKNILFFLPPTENFGLFGSFCHRPKI